MTFPMTEPKPKRARKPPAPRDPNTPSTRDIAKIVNYYLREVRMHDKSEYVGIFRQILLMCKKGITLAQVSQAAQNYAKAEFTRSCPPERRHHIRRFFMPERIKQWAATTETQTSDPSLSALHKLTEQKIAAQFDTPTIPVWKAEEEEEEPCPSAL